MVNNQLGAPRAPQLRSTTGGKPRILTFAGQCEFSEKVIQALRDCKGDLEAWREFCREHYGFKGNVLEHDLHTAILAITSAAYHAGAADATKAMHDERRKEIREKYARERAGHHDEEFSQEGC